MPLPAGSSTLFPASRSSKGSTKGSEFVLDFRWRLRRRLPFRRLFTQFILCSDNCSCTTKNVSHTLSNVLCNHLTAEKRFAISTDKPNFLNQSKCNAGITNMIQPIVCGMNNILVIGNIFNPQKGNKKTVEINIEPNESTKSTKINPINKNEPPINTTNIGADKNIPSHQDILTFSLILVSCIPNGVLSESLCFPVN